jgi:hypothetical protein
LAGVIFAVLVGTPILLTFVAFLMSDETREAERLVILDKQRKVRVDIGTGPDGTPRPILAGESGTPRMWISVGEKEVPKIELLDGAGSAFLDAIEAYRAGIHSRDSFACCGSLRVRKDVANGQTDFDRRQRHVAGVRDYFRM